MKSGGFVFDEHERKADRWCAQYEHWPASATKERNNRREERKEKKKSFSTNADAKLIANNAPFPLHSKYSPQVVLYIVTPLRSSQEQLLRLHLVNKVNQEFITLI